MAVAQVHHFSSQRSEEVDRPASVSVAAVKKTEIPGCVGVVAGLPDIEGILFCYLILTQLLGGEKLAQVNDSFHAVCLRKGNLRFRNRICPLEYLL